MEVRRKFTQLKRFIVVLCILGLSLAFFSGAGHPNVIRAQALDTAQWQDALPPDIAEALQQLDSQGLGSMTPDDSSVHDLMVVWTPAAETEIGGASKMASWIDGMVLRTNMAFRNSNVNHRLILTYKGQVPYTQADQTTDLYNLKDGVGALAAVHTLRNTYHADLVLMVRSNDGSGGQAFQLTTVNTAFSEWAYGVVPVGNLWSFPHELGHMLSSSHDWYTDGAGNAPYTYAHGHTSPATNAQGTLFLDIMTYGGGSITYPGGLYKILAFANPNLTYRGTPMGVLAGTKSNCTAGVEVGLCDADLSLAFNSTASTIAQLRSSEVRWTGAVGTDWNNANNWEITIGNPAAPTLQTIIPRAFDNVIIPSGLSNYPVISSGNLYVRDVTIQSGASLTMNGGTLKVSGNWRVQGSGAFAASGGTVIFNAALDKPVILQMSGASYFHHLQIGEGAAMPWVQLTSSLDVNGNLTLNAGCLFETGGFPVTLTGNWQDNGGGFDYTTSTVTFNGIGQTANAVSSAVVLNQDFSYVDWSVGTTKPQEPYGWANGLGTNGNPGSYWWFGDTGSGKIAVRSWRQVASLSDVDAWLFTDAVHLSAGVNYRLVFDYKVEDSSDPSDFFVSYGSHLLPSQMQSTIAWVTDAFNTTWSTANQVFSVPTSRAYNLGFRNWDSEAQLYEAYMDNIILTIEPVIPPDFGAAAPPKLLYLPLVRR